MYKYKVQNITSIGISHSVGNRTQDFHWKIGEKKEDGIRSKLNTLLGLSV
jgi:hypothetical protein